MRFQHHKILLTLFISATALAEVEELSNTEMTEAYIQDGAIVIKQRATTPTPKKQVTIKVGPGEPISSEADRVSAINTSNTNQSTIIGTELNNNLTSQQLQDNALNQSLQNLTFSAPLTSAQQAQQTYAQDLVRTGLGLPDGTSITPELMGQYLSTFNGQTYGNPIGAHQTVNTNGYQIVIPTAGAQLETGVFPSGDNSMNIDSTNQQLIFNLFFPKE